MESTASSSFINYFATTVILNFNFRVSINLLFYSAAVTAGVLTASKVVTFLLEELVKNFHYK